jgi:hypothetical protein
MRRKLPGRAHNHIQAALYLDCHIFNQVKNSNWSNCPR